MQLNIYLISHPIIQKLASDVVYANQLGRTNTYNNKYKKLGLLMIYEVLRKVIQTNHIYIKKINHIKEVCVFNRKESYIIMTDIADSYNMITDAINLFPQVYIQNLSLDKDHNIHNNKEIYNTIQSQYNNNTKIFLIQSNLESYSSIKILDFLILNIKIEIEAITLICITCHNRIIEKIGKRYPNLNIYTSKIMLD